MADRPKRSGSETETEIKDVMRQEIRRGRRPVDADEQRKRRKLARDFGSLLRLATETEFTRALRALGLRDDAPEFADALRVWRENRER